MNCENAQIAMMQHMDKTIKPADARELTRHILSCESCREYYLAFDEANDIENTLAAAPDGFTEMVMTKIRELPVYASPAKKGRGESQTILRVLWGLSAIFLGIGLLFIFNPDLLAAITAASPAAAGITDVLSEAGQFFTGIFDSLTQAAGTEAASSVLGMGIAALAFVITIGALLLALQRGEAPIKKSLKS